MLDSYAPVLLCSGEASRGLVDLEMGKCLRFFCCLLFCFLNPVTAVGIESGIGLTHHLWNIEDGLPDQMVFAVAQTPDGYLWLGTPHGLIRFDGFKFANVMPSTAPELEEFGVFCMLVAHDGTLWAGSVGGGVTHLSGGTAVHYGEAQGLHALSVRVLFQSADGTIWAGTDRGLYRLNQSGFEFVREVGEQWVTSIVPDGSDGFWLAGMNLVHVQHGNVHRIALPPLRLPVRALALGKDGRLWIGAYHLLLSLQPDGKIEAIKGVRADVRTLFSDSSGTVWIGTIGSGVLLCRPDGTLMQALSASERGAKAIRAFARTSNGDLWLGTQDGLMRLSVTGMDFVHVPLAAGTDYSSVFVDRDGSVWLSAGGLSHLVDGVAHSVALPQQARSTIRCIFRERGGALWVGTLSGGAFRIERGVVTAHFVSRLGSNSVTGFAEAPDGSVWIGTDNGLVRWAHRKMTIFDGNSQYPLGIGTVRALTFAPDGSIWLATPVGVYLFRHGAFSRPDATGPLSHLRVFSLYADREGALWIGAGTGLYLWRDKVLRPVDLPHSPEQTRAVISILRDARDRFLIATPDTVFRIKREELERSIREARSPEGAARIRMDLNGKLESFAVARETGAEMYSDIPQLGDADARGGAWYASSQGLVHIRPDPVKRQEMPPAVAIERVVVDGVPVAARGPIVLSPAAHNIEIVVTPILLSAGTGLQLRRRLIGLEDGWSDLVPGSSSNYGKLPPGRYVFRAEASWPGGAKSSAVELAIVQQTSIYRRKWFLGLCGLALALLSWFFYHVRLQEMRLRFQAVAAERNRVACEIHDTLLQGCIGAASLLEAVEISQNLSSAEPSVGQQQGWRATLSYAREQMTETIKEARDAIWNLRNDDDQKPLDEALRDVLERLTSRANVQTSFRCEGERLKLMARARHELLMAAREAILNALAHARPSRIDVRVNFTRDAVSVHVADDGVGFEANEEEIAESGHFGLEGMRDRMCKLGGDMSIESHLGRGTLVSLSLPAGRVVIRPVRSRG